MPPRVIKCHTTRVTQRRPVPLAVEAKLDEKIGPLSAAREWPVTQVEEPSLPGPFQTKMFDIPHRELRKCDFTKLLRKPPLTRRYKSLGKFQVGTGSHG
jgi:hypothetical protein